MQCLLPSISFYIFLTSLVLILWSSNTAPLFPLVFVRHTCKQRWCIRTFNHDKIHNSCLYIYIKPESLKKVWNNLQNMLADIYSKRRLPLNHESLQKPKSSQNYTYKKQREKQSRGFRWIFKRGKNTVIACVPLPWIIIRSFCPLQ